MTPQVINNYFPDGYNVTTALANVRKETGNVCISIIKIGVNLAMIHSHEGQAEFERIAQEGLSMSRSSAYSYKRIGEVLGQFLPVYEQAPEKLGALTQSQLDILSMFPLDRFALDETEHTLKIDGRPVDQYAAISQDHLIKLKDEATGKVYTRLAKEEQRNHDLTEQIMELNQQINRLQDGILSPVDEVAATTLLNLAKLETQIKAALGKDANDMAIEDMNAKVTAISDRVSEIQGIILDAKG